MICPQRLQRVGCIFWLHHVLLLGLKIDHDLVQQQIPTMDLTKAPTFVQTKCAGFQLIEYRSVFGCQITRIDQRLKVGIHREEG